MKGLVYIVSVSPVGYVVNVEECVCGSPDLTEGPAWLRLRRHVLHHPLLMATELIVTFNLQELDLFFPSVLFTLQSAELSQNKHVYTQTNKTT